jgi:hypothetical protein
MQESMGEATDGAKPHGGAKFFLEKEAFGLYWVRRVPSFDDERIDASIEDLPVKKPFT